MGFSVLYGKLAELEVLGIAAGGEALPYGEAKAADESSFVNAGVAPFDVIIDALDMLLEDTAEWLEKLRRERLWFRLKMELKSARIG